MNSFTAAPVVQRRIIPKKQAWIHAMGVGQIISWGTLYYSFPLIAESITQELRFSKSEAYGAATIALLSSAFFAYPVGKLIDQGRGRSIMAGGCLIAGLLLAAWSQISSIGLFFVIAFLLGVTQSMTLYEAAFATIANQPGHPLSDSITKLTLWGGFASTLFVPITESLIVSYGWRSALLALGIVNVAAAGLYYKTLPQGADVELPVRFGKKVNQQQSISFALKSKVFWALLLAFGLYSLVFSGLSFHIYALFAERGLSTSTIVLGMMLLGPAQVLGRVILWKFANPRMNVTRAGGYVLLAFPLSVAAIIFASPFLGMIVFIVIYGMANGVMTIIRGNAVPEMLSPKYYGELNSYLTVPSTIFKAVGPFVLAWFTQQLGSYNPVLVGIFSVTIFILLSYWYAEHFGQQ